jgi:hypothetical protein
VINKDLNKFLTYIQILDLVKEGVLVRLTRCIKEEIFQSWPILIAERFIRFHALSLSVAFYTFLWQVVISFGIFIGLFL